MPKKAESEYRDHLADELEAANAVCYKQHGSQYSKRGTPDILACIPGPYTGIGYFVAIECKMPDGIVADAQTYELARIRENGRGLAIIATQGVINAETILMIVRVVDKINYDKTLASPASGL